ncbi:MAG TPA: endo-1,4-beta-xylanase [Abditibacteriaceae bacterium]
MIQKTGAEPVSIVANSDFLRGEESWDVPNTEYSDSTFIDANAGPYTRALRVTARPPQGANPWEISLRQDIPVPLKKDDPLVLKLWARSPESLQIGAFVEQAAAPYNKLVNEVVKLSPQWTEYEVRGQSDADYPTGSAHVVFHMGHGRGIIEVAGVRLFNPNAPVVALARSTASPEKPESLVENGTFEQPLQGNWNWGDGAPIQSQVVEANINNPDAREYSKALRLTVTPGPQAQPWSVQVGQPVRQFVGRNDAVYFRGWMRSPTRTRIGVIYEMGREPHTKYLREVVKLTPEWKEYRFLGYVDQPFQSEESQFKFFLGYEPGTVEIAGVRLENYGIAPENLFTTTTDWYGGVEVSDAWRKPALERIEKIRKGDIRVLVTDATGRPVPDSTVSIEQKRHLFRFGSAVVAGRLTDTSNPDNLRYQAEVKRLFNTVVFENDMKWPQSDNNMQNIARVEKALEWLRANNIAVRGHNLVWGSERYMPERTRSLSAEELAKVVEERTRAFAGRFKGQIYTWDVVNEAATNTWLWEKIGWANFADTYKWAREADPNALLAYNDYDMVNEAASGGNQRKIVKQRIEYLLDNGAPLDIIGDQAHMGVPLTPISRVLEITDELAQYGKRIEFTELDLGVKDDKLHGEYVRDFLIAAFSHPSVDAVIQWGFWENAHWRARDGGAMFRKDWSKRPAQEAYEDLVLNQWWTRATGKADAQGTYATRAFYGTHTITVEQGGRKTTQEVQLLPGKAGTVTIKLAQ